jgi:ribosomal protein S18 acetylase RimI-like enzyme
MKASRVMTRSHVDVVSSVSEAETRQLWPVYAAVFDDQPDMDTWRASTWDRHSVRNGFRLARAWEGDRLIGFAYGYTGERGQWWTDRAMEVLPPETARAWLGGHFELVSLGVLPESRRSGIGRALLRTLTGDLPQGRRLLMSTSDERDPARQLYASEGWRVIGPGLGADQVILGIRTRSA